MDNLSSVVQFIDPFDITSTVEISSSEAEKSTQIWAIVKPVIIRFSYQDIQFFTVIWAIFQEVRTESENAAIMSGNMLTVDNQSELSLNSTSSGSDVSVSPALEFLIIICWYTGFNRYKSISSAKVNWTGSSKFGGDQVVFIDDFTNVHIP